MTRSLLPQIKSLLPTWTIAASLPFVIRAALPEDAGFAFLGLGLGCAVLAAFSAGSSRREEADHYLDQSASSPRRLRSRSRRTAILALAAAAIFTLFGAVPHNPAGLPIPLLAALTVVPALGIVPYLTLLTGRPFVAIVFSAFIVAAIKLISCVVVRFVYGPDALADGYMAGDWQTAKLMISLFWIGTVTLSIVLGFACHRRVSIPQPTAVHA